MQLYELVIFIIKIVFVAIIILSIVIGVIVPLMQNFSNKSNRRSIESPVVRRSPRQFFPIPDEEEEIEIPTNIRTKDDEKREIVKMALDDATKTTQLVRNWINEKK
ncbi:hypothetical protein KJ966_09075 [bacterium]|nr:hypothetical protein [bacterium]